MKRRLRSHWLCILTGEHLLEWDTPLSMDAHCKRKGCEWNWRLEIL